MTIQSGIGWLTFVAVVSAGLSWARSADTRPADERIEVRLPAAKTTGGMSLSEALAKRRSQRSFQDRPLTMDHVAQLCWAAQGITDTGQGYRTAPSAKALYPIRAFIVDAEGAWEYLPRPHALGRIGGVQTLDGLRATIGQPALKAAPAFMVLTMEPAVLEARFSKRAERYSLLEAGHVAQNVLLQATALGLASVPIGGLDEGNVAAALGLPAGQRPVYVLPLGHPAEQD